MESYNYNQFIFNEKNREISPKNVRDIKNSILEVGFIKQRPILINEENLIIDGHHRFLALKELQMPICYEVENKISLKEMILLNSSQRSWTLSDFIYLYAKENIKAYKELVLISENYNLTMSNTIIIVLKNAASGAGTSKGIKNGYDFEIYEKKDELIQLILTAKENIGFSIKKDFVISLRFLLDRANFKQIQKVIDNFSSIREQTSINNYLITFENIINRKMGDANKINLLNK